MMDKYKALYDEYMALTDEYDKLSQPFACDDLSQQFSYKNRTVEELNDSKERALKITLRQKEICNHVKESIEKEIGYKIRCLTLGKEGANFIMIGYIPND